MEISIHLTDEEYLVASEYAQRHLLSLEEALKRALFECIEDEYDSRIGQEAMEEYMQDGGVSYPIERLWEALSL